MSSERRNVALLTACQAMLLTNNSTLIAINGAVWLLILTTGAGSSQWVERLALSPRVCTAGNHPGSYYPRVTTAAQCAQTPDGHWGGVAGGDVYQLVTSMFTHVQVWHIGFNMLALWFLGPQLERLDAVLPALAQRDALAEQRLRRHARGDGEGGSGRARQRAERVALGAPQEGRIDDHRIARGEAPRSDLGQPTIGELVLRGAVQPRAGRGSAARAGTQSVETLALHVRAHAHRAAAR